MKSFLITGAVLVLVITSAVVFKRQQEWMLYRSDSSKTASGTVVLHDTKLGIYKSNVECMQARSSISTAKEGQFDNYFCGNKCSWLGTYYSCKGQCGVAGCL